MIFTKSQLKVLNDSGVEQDPYTLTGDFQDCLTAASVCSNAGEILLLFDWNPGDEDYLDVLPYFSCNKEDGQFYRPPHQDDIGYPPEQVVAGFSRIEAADFDEGIDQAQDKDGSGGTGYYVTHYCSLILKPKGTHFKLRFRGRMDDESDPLDPGTIRVYSSLRV